MLDKEWENYLEKYEQLYHSNAEKRKEEIPNLMKVWELFLDEAYTVTDIYIY